MYIYLDQNQLLILSVCASTLRKEEGAAEKPRAAPIPVYSARGSTVNKVKSPSFPTGYIPEAAFILLLSTGLFGFEFQSFATMFDEPLHSISLLPGVHAEYRAGNGKRTKQALLESGASSDRYSISYATFCNSTWYSRGK